MTVASPVLLMVAGPNGAGKTTLVQSLRAARGIRLPEHYINADDLKRERRLHDRAAQQLAEVTRLQAIAQRRSFMYETVMSHPSKIAELQAAAVAGYSITVVFVATRDPAINIERVVLRVADGGHPVPKERIRARHTRSIALAPSAIALAAHAYIYDNSEWGAAAPQQLQAVLDDRRLRPIVDQPAPWVGELIEAVNARAAELESWHAGAKRGTLMFPNLSAGVCEGRITEAGRYFVLQTERLSGKVYLHDKALLPKPLGHRQSYRIEYAQGVASVTRQPSGRIRAVDRHT